MFDTPFVTFTLYSVKFLPVCSIHRGRRFCKRFFRNFLIIFRLFPVVGFYCPADLNQKVLGNLVGSIAQVVEDCRGRKFGDTGKILVLQVVAGVQTAAGQKGVLDAGGQYIPETHLQVEAVQLLQQTVPHVVGQVGELVPVDLTHRPRRQLHELFTDTAVLGGAVLPLQCRHNSGVVLRLHLPQVGRPRAPNRTGVRHIKNVLQMGPSAAVFTDQGDALRTGFHPAPHSVVPQFHAGTGRGVRALGMEQELVIERIFVEPATGVQVPFPTVHASCDFVGGVVCQLGYELKFAYHGYLLVLE